MKFDIVEFYYPSIFETLLQKAIISKIDEDKVNLILHCRKSLFFDQNDTWIKQGGNLFDVTLGSFEGSGVCKLVGLFWLHDLKSLTENVAIGLYRDDRIKNEISKIFQRLNLKITLEANLIHADFLDNTFNLKSVTH